MIFYFSGTGNSKYAANYIGKVLSEKVISIAEEALKNDKEYYLEQNEVIGFIYPTYAWGAPKLVIDFIKRIKLKNYNKNYIFSIATCGANIGNTMETMKNVLKHKSLTLNSGFSLVMPNNYMLMGDVDSKEVEDKKLKAAEIRLKDISKILVERKNNIIDVEKGTMPWFLSSVINPLFTKFSMNTKKFYADSKCIGCKTCEKACPTKNIIVNGKTVKWGGNCTLCLACINRCPVTAIQYGKSTKNKGRYVNKQLESLK